MEYRRTASAEFPNDNPDLHQGALWIVSQPCDPARLLARPEPRSEPPPEPAEGEFDVPDIGDEGVLDVDVDAELLAPDAVAQSFSVFVSALARVAMDAGASRLAAALPGFLERGILVTDGLAPEVIEALVSRGFAGPGEGGLRASASCAVTCGAWRRVLSGQSDDLSACGTSTLDGWAAELLAAALGAPTDAVKKLRRELRRHGVAAFGIIAHAA